MSKTILLPISGGDHTDRTIEYAFDRAGDDDAVVHALSVVDTARYGEPALSSGEIVVDEVETEGEKRLAEVAARGAARGVEVATHSCHGRPGDELLAFARDIGADAVVADRRIPHATRDRLEHLVDAVVTPGRRLEA
ncbi:MAG: universal stress protein [Haloarculaceae archaeon]